MMKYIITDFKKINIYGDCHLEKDGYFIPFIGKEIKVKILGLFWLTYRKYTKEDIKY